MAYDMARSLFVAASCLKSPSGANHLSEHDVRNKGRAVMFGRGELVVGYEVIEDRTKIFG